MAHPAERRSWLQTGGMPVDDIHLDLRAAIDRVDNVTYLGGACFKLFDRHGAQIGIVQMQGIEQKRLDEAVMATTQRLAAGEERTPDVLAGDTVVRELDMRNPIDREMAARARTGEAPAVSFPDIERNDPPPIELPDYVAPENVPHYTAPDAAYDDWDVAAKERAGWPWIVLAYGLSAAIVAAVIYFAVTGGGANG